MPRGAKVSPTRHAQGAHPSPPKPRRSSEIVGEDADQAQGSTGKAGRKAKSKGKKPHHSQAQVERIPSVSDNMWGEIVREGAEIDAIHTEMRRAGAETRAEFEEAERFVNAATVNGRLSSAIEVEQRAAQDQEKATMDQEKATKVV